LKRGARITLNGNAPPRSSTGDVDLNGDVVNAARPEPTLEELYSEAYGRALETHRLDLLHTLNASVHELVRRAR
jgi:hypothetical protein